MMAALAPRERRPRPEPARSRSITIRDVARRAEVSVASASRALNGRARVHELTRERVLRAAEELRYVPHVGARSLSTRRTDTIGVVLPELHGEYFSELIRGVDAGCRARGLHLLVSTSHDDAGEASAAIRSMRGRVDGMLVMSPHVDAQVLAGSLANDIPVVLLNTRITGARHAAFRVDNHGGAWAMAQHLAAGGARRLIHIAGPETNYEAAERRRGFLDATEALGIEAEVLQGDFSQESGARAGAAIAAREVRPDAVFAANDLMAVGCLNALQAAGAAVPDEIGVAGFDDIPIARMTRPALSTMRVHIAELGRAALERLAASLSGSAETSFAVQVARPELVARGSTSAARPDGGIITNRGGEAA